MIIQDTLYLFKLQAERVDTKKSQDLSLPKAIIILNSAQINLVKTKYGTNNLYRSGFEATQKRKQDLQRLSVISEELKDPKQHGNEYRFDLSKTLKPFLFDTRVQFKAAKNKCKDIILKGVPAQTDDMNLIDMNAFKKPSFEWRRTSFRVADDRIVAESDGTFAIEGMILDYLRYPEKMDIAGYKKFDGTASVNKDCELPEFLIPELIDQATLEFKLWTQDPSYQFAQLKKTVSE